jgi:spore coat protein H
MRKMFSWLPKSRGKRVFAIIGLILGGGFLFLLTVAIAAFFLFRSPKFQSWLWPALMRRQATAALPDPPAVPPGPVYNGHSPSAAQIHAAADLFQTTNIWKVHLKFSQKEWKELGPNYVQPVSEWMQPDGRPLLRNPKAARAGIAGVFGFDFPWSRGDLEFGGVWFTNAGLRFKGNGTFLSAIQTHKRPFKVDLNKHEKKQEIVGRTVLNFGNLSADLSFLSDALAYEFFRDAGVPAPRTAFARMFLTIDGKFAERLLGFYVLVENPDTPWADEIFGVKEVALFKPVTHELFNDLGGDWKSYDAIYDPKTKASERQQQRVIEVAKLVTHANDDDFAKGIGQFFDLAECARFLACEVMLAHYDGILAQGQNFLLYLDPRSDKFGIIPWDMDHAWGEFPFISTAERREQSSIWHPWVGENRFLERLLGVEDFKQRYKAELERLLKTLFVPERLNRRIDELAAIVRPAIAEESPQRLAKFETAVSDQLLDGPRDGNPFDPNRPVHQLKRFIATRAQNVREQLDGKTQGVIPVRQGPPR